MCDIYLHKCLLCDNTIEMHLADFETDRDEIDIICHDCLQKMLKTGDYNELYNLPYKTFTLWVYFPEFLKKEPKIMIVIHKTRKAYKMREGNHPNEWYAGELFTKHPLDEIEDFIQELKNSC